MKNLSEFSKKVIYLLILVWFFGAMFGCVCVGVQLIRGDYSVGLSELLTYIGAPMTGGIVGYMLKSGFENKERFKQAAAAGKFKTCDEIKNEETQAEEIVSDEILKKINEV